MAPGLAGVRASQHQQSGRSPGTLPAQARLPPLVQQPEGPLTHRLLFYRERPKNQ